MQAHGYNDKSKSTQIPSSMAGFSASSVKTTKFINYGAEMLPTRKIYWGLIGMWPYKYKHKNNLQASMNKQIDRLTNI
jgi:hypothetical protein